MTRLRRIDDDQSGIAMIVAILVTFVVFLLSIFVVQLSTHNSRQSAYDRKRVQSVDAAEAGLHYMWSTIEGQPPQSLPCDTTATGTLGTSPGTATYSVDVAYYKSDGTSLGACPDQSHLPASVLLTSTGTTDAGVQRKMQSYATLTPTYSGIGAAILTNTGTALLNNFSLVGNSGDDADIYVLSGDANLTNAPVVHGNIYIPNGGFSSANNNTVYGDVWAKTAITINTPARVTGEVISSTSSISGSGAIGLDATAGTTISSNLVVSGSRYPNSPQGNPPSQSFPYVCYDNTISGVCTAQSASWTAAGYTNVQTFTTCSAASTYLTTGTVTANTIVRITAVCNLAMNGTTVTQGGNLAIITNGSITMSNNNNWNWSGGGANKDLFFLVNYQSQTSQCGTGSYNITTANNSSFNNVNVSFYTPCTVTIQNLNTFKGQLIGGTVATANNFTMNFVPVLIPGATTTVKGFNQSIQYIREVA
jgi:Tfp pilus assembly protein PilX